MDGYGASVRRGEDDLARDRRSRRCCTASLMSRTKGEASACWNERRRRRRRRRRRNGGQRRGRSKGRGRGEKDCFLVARTSLSSPPLFRSLVVLFSRPGKAGLHTRRANEKDRERERERGEDRS